MTIDTVEQPNHENDATHPASVPLTHSSTPAFGRKNPEQAAAYEKLRQRLTAVGINIDALDYRTGPGETPDCFTMEGASYPAWLKDGMSANDMPVRYDMPAEPNYCNDCTPEFKSRAMKAGTCIFPNTRFEVRKTDGERETVGVSRSAEVPPEHCVIYQEMTVPLSALHVRLKDYFRNHRIKALARVEMPLHLRKHFDPMGAQRSKKELPDG